MTESDLIKLKKKIEDAKASANEANGHLKALMKQLKDDWKCLSIEAAEKKLKTMKVDMQELDQKIDTAMAELEEKYETD